MEKVDEEEAVVKKPPKPKEVRRLPENPDAKGEFEELYEVPGESEERKSCMEEEEEEEEAEEEMTSVSTTFSQLTVHEASIVDLKNSPRYKEVVGFIKDILRSLVAKRPENVIDYFAEYSRRVHEKLIQTFGIQDRYFTPAAQLIARFIRIFYIGFDKMKDDDFDDELPFPAIEEEKEDEERVDEEEMEKNMDYYANHVLEYVLEDENFDENGRHGKPVFYDPKIDYEFNEFDYNFLDQMKIFHDVGLTLDTHEMFEIHMALIQLVKKRKLQNLKFWGKIKGLYRDYYIVEADMYSLEEEIYDELEEVEEPAPHLIPDYGSIHLFEEEEEGKVEPGLLRGLLPDGELEEELGIEDTEMVKEEEDEDEMIPPMEEQVPETYPEENVEEEEEEKLEKEISNFELEVADPRDAIPLMKLTLKNYKLPPMPKLKWKPEKQPPIEDPGEGVNKKIYFVSNDPKNEWIRLPHVTPEQIVTARQIKKFFTGYLSARILSFPIFPGIEMNYLRAQIARISAATQVSPAGYFRFDEGEEAYDFDDIAAGKGGTVLLNKEFDPISIKDLTDPTLAFWVHHTPYILNQGRTVWFNVNKKEKKTGEEEFGEMGEMYEEPVQGETGPPLLTSLAEDIYFDGIPPWTVRPAFKKAPSNACVYVRSNLWPGSFSFNWGRKIGFLYIGWGHKFKPFGFTPWYPYPPMKEYPDGPEIKEDRDPTVAEEDDYKKRVEAWYAKMHPPMPSHLGEGEVEEEEDY